MRHPVRLVALALAVALVGPAAASAHDHSSIAGVRQHAKSADRALDKTAARVRSGADIAAQRTLRTGRRQLRAARREAAKLRRAARRGGSVRRAVAADRSVATVAGSCVETLSGAVPQASGPIQLDMAQTIGSCVSIRQAIVDALTQLLQVVPEPARPIISQLIAALSTTGPDQANAIGGALTTPGLPPDVATTLTQALQLVTQAIDLATSQLATILPLVPSFAQPLVQGALDLVTQQLHQVTTMIGNLLGGLIGSTPGTPTDPTSGTGFDIWGLLNSVLGWVLPF